MSTIENASQKTGQQIGKNSLDEQTLFENERIATIMFKRACDDCAPENFEVSDLSEITGCTKSSEIVKPMVKHSEFIDIDPCQKDACGQLAATLVSAEKKDFHVNI